MLYQELTGYKYRTVKDLWTDTGIIGEGVKTTFIELVECGKLAIRSWYAWDGSSVVRDTKACMTASLIHDALYQLMRLGLLGKKYRKHADRLYRDMCIQNGMKPVFARIRYIGLRLFGWCSLRPGKYTEHKIIEVK